MSRIYDATLHKSCSACETIAMRTVREAIDGVCDRCRRIGLIMYWLNESQRAEVFAFAEMLREKPAEPSP